MNVIRRLPSTGLSHFGDFVSQFRKITDHYGNFGRVDYVFDIYSEHPSVKDSERQRRTESAPNNISMIEESTPFPRDLKTFWPSNENKQRLSKLIYSNLKGKHTSDYPIVISQVTKMDNA
jgi:hypothetical protein